jgi:hypothetical protein
MSEQTEDDMKLLRLCDELQPVVEAEEPHTQHIRGVTLLAFIRAARESVALRGERNEANATLTDACGGLLKGNLRWVAGLAAQRIARLTATETALRSDVARLRPALQAARSEITNMSVAYGCGFSLAVIDDVDAALAATEPKS